MNLMTHNLREATLYSKITTHDKRESKRISFFQTKNLALTIKGMITENHLFCFNHNKSLYLLLTFTSGYRLYCYSLKTRLRLV